MVKSLAASVGPTPTTDNAMTTRRFLASLFALLIPLAWPATMATLAQKALAPGSGQHDYFQTLARRSDHLVSYSLRDPAQLAPRARGGFAQSADRTLGVTYDPASDRYPRKQDAAKVLIESDANNLRNQVRLPLQHGAEGFLLTWDAWWGEEFRFDRTGIRNYKAFQLESGGGIWTEVRARFQGAHRFRGAVALVDVRAYGGSAARRRSRVGDVNYGGGSVGGQLATFAIAPNTWTRYWVQITPRAASEWWDLSMWMADEARGPVQLFKQEAIKPKGKGWDRLWLEYNTSTNGVKPGRGELVSYVRNVVVLKPLGDVSTILQRPVGTGAPQTPSPSDAPTPTRPHKSKQPRP